MRNKYLLCFSVALLSAQVKINKQNALGPNLFESYLINSADILYPKQNDSSNSPLTPTLCTTSLWCLQFIKCRPICLGPAVTVHVCCSVCYSVRLSAKQFWSPGCEMSPNPAVQVPVPSLEAIHSTSQSQRDNPASFRLSQTLTNHAGHRPWRGVNHEYSKKPR